MSPKNPNSADSATDGKRWLVKLILVKIAGLMVIAGLTVAIVLNI